MLTANCKLDAEKFAKIYHYEDIIVVNCLTKGRLAALSMTSLKRRPQVFLVLDELRF